MVKKDQHFPFGEVFLDLIEHQYFASIYTINFGLSGMDPAQPHFTGTPTLVRLDRSDALFTDVIHTNTKPFVSGGEFIVYCRNYVSPNKFFRIPG